MAGKRKILESNGLKMRLVSVSDSKGTAIDEKGLNPKEIVKCKSLQWKDFPQYHVGYVAAVLLLRLVQKKTSNMSSITPENTATANRPTRDNENIEKLRTDEVT